MPEFMTEFFNWMQHPDMLSLGTVAGLAGFLKLIAVPALKWAAAKAQKPISGAATVVVAFVASALIAEGVGWYVHGAISPTIMMQMLGVSVLATLSAFGMQTTTGAVARKDQA